MGHLYFHCSNPKGVLVDRCGAAISDLAAARNHATHVVRSLLMTRTGEDWRSWVLHVNDELGAELFAMPFVFVLRKSH